MLVTRRLVALIGVEQGLNFAVEGVQIVETTIHRSKAHISNRIKIAQCSHDQVTNTPRWDFPFGVAANPLFDLAQSEIDLHCWYWALAQRPTQSGEEFFLTIRLPASICLDHHRESQIRTLVGSEALVADGALPAAAHRLPIIDDAGVDDPGVVMGAKGAVHR